MGKDMSKPVKLRRRHKTLDHIPEKDTENGFKWRMPAEALQGGTSGPAICTVLRANQTLESFEMNNENYSKASTKFDNLSIQDWHDPNTGRGRSRPSTSNRSMVGEPGISTSSSGKQASSRTSKKKDSCGNDWGVIIEPNLGGDSMWQSDAYFSNPQQITYQGLGFGASHLYAPQVQFTESSAQLSSLTVVEDKHHQTAYGYSVDLLNDSQPEQTFPPYSRIPWSPFLQSDFSLPNAQMISSDGQQFPFYDHQFSQPSSQNTPPHNEGQQDCNIYPIWPSPATYPSSTTGQSCDEEHNF